MLSVVQASATVPGPMQSCRVPQEPGTVEMLFILTCPLLPLLSLQQFPSAGEEALRGQRKLWKPQHEIWLQEEKEESQVLAPCCSLLNICFDARVDIPDKY